VAGMDEAYKALVMATEVKGFSETEGLTDPDDAPEPPEVATTISGDLWLLGEHRVLCGDSTSGEAVGRLCGATVADLMVTDPPYGIRRDEGFDGHVGFRGLGKPIARRRYQGGWDDAIPPKECFDLLIGMTQAALIFGGNFFAHLLPQGKHWIVWDKNNTMPTFGDAELIWTNISRTSIKIKRFQYNGLLGKEKERFHPTQKPMALIQDILNDYSSVGDSVLDPFLGSGTTIIAAEQTGRICYGMEIAPEYVDVIVNRWQNFTGKQATLDGDGRTFSQIKAERFGVRLGWQDQIKEEAIEAGMVT